MDSGKQEDGEQVVAVLKLPCGIRGMDDVANGLALMYDGNLYMRTEGDSLIVFRR